MVHFSLTSLVYAAHFENAIILLDIKNDNYLSLIDDSAEYLRYVLNTPFKRLEHGKYEPIPQSEKYPEYSFWISEFLKNAFIQENASDNRKNIASIPPIPGGLREYQWDTKTDWKSLKKGSFWGKIKAFWVLAKVHKILKKNKLAGIFDLIKKNNKSYSYNPTHEEIERLSAEVDAASILYFKKTYCLVWATTFCILALKKGWPCKLVIGIQTNPFYAHAWAEINDKVINDDPQVNQVLSIMCKLPENR